MKKPKVGRVVKEELRRFGWQGMELQHQRKAEPVKPNYGATSLAK